MIIKKYQAKTEEEAVEAAKKELGENVYVMNVKNVKKKGIFSFFSPQMTEVTVALEDETDKAIQQKASSRNITEALGKVGSIVEKAEKEDKLLVGREASYEASAFDKGKAYEKPVTYEKPRPVAKPAAQTSEGVGATGAAIEKKLDSIQNLIERNLQTDNEKPAREEEPKKAEAEETAKEENEELKKFFSLLKTTMTDNEVAAEYAETIVADAEKTTKPGTPFDVALAGIYQKMVLKFGKAEVISPAGRGPKVVFFVGPTGVGKTTTIAKIASLFSVVEKKKIALLTADTYRIAAAEQLRTYANILEVPFRIIYTIEEMQSALKDFTDFDYVFVDTAGHSHQNREQKQVMGEFIHSVDGLYEKEVYLVVSATTKYRDLKSIADAYTEITDYKLIFTKLDETTALGNLLNLKLYTGADLSYVTCGQNVPDDMEEFNAQKTVKNLLGGKR